MNTMPHTIAAIAYGSGRLDSSSWSRADATSTIVVVGGLDWQKAFGPISLVVYAGSFTPSKRDSPAHAASLDQADDADLRGDKVAAESVRQP